MRAFSTKTDDDAPALDLFFPLVLRALSACAYCPGLPTSSNEFHRQFVFLQYNNNTLQRDKPTTTANRPQTRHSLSYTQRAITSDRHCHELVSHFHRSTARHPCCTVTQCTSSGRAQRRAGVSNSSHSRSSEGSEPSQSSRRSLRSGRSTTHTHTHTYTHTQIIRSRHRPSRSHGCLARVYMIRTKERRRSPQQACSLRASIAGSACGNLQQSLSARRARA